MVTGGGLVTEIVSVSVFMVVSVIVSVIDDVLFSVSVAVTVSVVGITLVSVSVAVTVTVSPPPLPPEGESELSDAPLSPEDESPPSSEPPPGDDVFRLPLDVFDNDNEEDEDVLVGIDHPCVGFHDMPGIIVGFGFIIAVLSPI